jgi:hypothetical protein
MAIAVAVAAETLAEVTAGVVAAEMAEAVAVDNLYLKAPKDHLGLAELFFKGHGKP